MALINQTAETLFQDVGVDLGGRDVGVAEQLLDGPQIGTAVEQVAGEGVAQDVGAHPLGCETDRQGEILQLLTETLAGEVAFGAA